MVRYYRSRVNFKGNLGPSWDHNLNPRIFFNGSENGCETEVVVSLGDLNPIPMRPNAEGSNDYEGGSGESAVRLKRRDDEQCAWRLRLANAYQYCFDDEGLATTITAPNGGRLVFDWADRTTANARVSSVKRFLKGTNEQTHTLKFAYSGTTLTKVHLDGSEDATRSNYEYNGKGQLDRVRDARGTRARYKYDPTVRTTNTEVPVDGLDTYCERYCSFGSECGAESYCAQVVAVRAQDCGRTRLCSDGCDDTWEALIDNDVRQCMGEGHFPEKLPRISRRYSG